MEERALDALLVHHFPNISYLSGYQSWNTGDYYALIVPAQGEPTLVLWASERSNAVLSSWVTNIGTYPTRGDPVAVTIDVLHNHKVGRGRIGIELDSTFLSVRNYQRIVSAFPNATFVDCSGLVQQVRVVKSPAELEYIRQAAQITPLGIRAAVDRIEDNATDQEIATAAYHALIGGGSGYMCIPPVISAGPLSGVPHSTHRGVVLRSGDTVLLEVGACIHRYTAPIMRSAVLGQPNDIVKRMADAILAALNSVIEAMVPGRPFDEIAAIGEEAIAQAGPNMIFHHTFAYSVGLGYPPTWADCPVTIVKGDETALQPGMVFHLPIALRYEGRHGVAMSETLVITETGNEVLTELDRKLLKR
jgi:Xaa-Pro dipeptidase